MNENTSKIFKPALNKTFVTLLYKNNRKGGLGFQYAGKSEWEPSFFLRLRFVLGARHILQDGYSKVNGAIPWRPNIGHA
jgi:hypothetical protein